MRSILVVAVLVAGCSARTHESETHGGVTRTHESESDADARKRRGRTSDTNAGERSAPQMISGLAREPETQRFKIASITFD